MPFTETCAVNERVRFCVTLERGDTSMSELCRQFGISRTTGYEVWERWQAGGAAALVDRSHAPHQCPHALDDERRETIIALRRKHPTWGPKKLKARLSVIEPEIIWPATSTIGDLLARDGLSVARKRRRHVSPRTDPLAAATAANETWSMDFKGWFRTSDGARCDPLTIQDQASRYLIRVVAVAKCDGAHVWSIFDAAFREFGLPIRMRSDNGPPFASTGAGGLSVLSVKLIKAGIRPERIDPASPQQNGRLERLHRTLKADTAQPPAGSLAAQARRFRAFQATYNDARPHEALGLIVPASVYAASSRRWSGRLVSPDYETGALVRRVRHNGAIKWRGDHIFVSLALIGEPVCISETEHGSWQVCYGPIVLGTLAGGRLQRPRAVRGPGGRSRDARPTDSATTAPKTVNHHAG